MSITQDELGWLDLAPFQDVVLYLDCREVTSNPTILFQTSPARDDALFQTIGSGTLVASSTPTVFRALMLSSSVPLARYVRWKINGPASSWDATFRVLVAANSPGM